jgi:glycogen synthase
MRIGIFTRVFSPSIGGLETLAETLATEISSQGHEVTVITDEPNIASPATLDKLFSVVRTQTFQGRVRSFRNVDVILFFNLSLVGLFAAWCAFKPVVMSHHGIYRGAGRISVFLEWVKRQLTRYYVNISVSSFVASRIPGQSIIIHNAFNSSLFPINDTDSKSRDFVFCGRLVPEKGPLLCLQAFKIILAEFPDATLTIVGQGAEFSQLRHFVVDNELNRQVNFTGPLTGTDLADEIRCHTCMVIPSVWQEPFGIVALEGLASCDTVIATRSGGLPEALGPCGLIVEPCEQSIGSAMASVLKAKVLGTAIPGSSSRALLRAHLAKHLPHVVANRYLDLIREKFNYDRN